MATNSKFQRSNEKICLKREQPVTGLGLKILETILRTSRETSCVGLTNSAFLWSSVNMTRPWTRECSAAPMESSTRYWND